MDALINACLFWCSDISILVHICLTWLNQTQQWKRWIWPLTFQTNQYQNSTAQYFSALAPSSWSEILATNWIVDQIINPGAGSEQLTAAATLEASVSSCRRQRGMLPCWLLECAAALNCTKCWRRCYKKNLLIATTTASSSFFLTIPSFPGKY